MEIYSEGTQLTSSLADYGSIYDEAEPVTRMAVRGLLLSQEANSHTQAHKKTGEFGLMYATLQDAIRCFQRNSLKSGRRAERFLREVEEWFFTNDYIWPFSFVNICSVLDLDPGYIRMGLRNWQMKYGKKPTSSNGRSRLSNGNGAKAA